MPHAIWAGRCGSSKRRFMRGVEARAAVSKLRARSKKCARVHQKFLACSW